MFRCQQAPRDHGAHQGGTVSRGLCQPAGHHIRLSALCHVDLGSDFSGSSCAFFTSLPTGAPCGTLTTWGRPSLALMPSPGAGLNTTGNIRLPSASPTPSPSPAALTSRTPLVYDSGLVHHYPTVAHIHIFSFSPHIDTFHVPFLRWASGLLSSLS